MDSQTFTASIRLGVSFLGLMLITSAIAILSRGF
jgi:hypothetical protein